MWYIKQKNWVALDCQWFEEALALLNIRSKNISWSKTVCVNRRDTPEFTEMRDWYGILQTGADKIVLGYFTEPEFIPA